MFCLLFADWSVENMIPGVTPYGMLLDAWGKIYRTGATNI